jgi:hypothetical protein
MTQAIHRSRNVNTIVAVLAVAATAAAQKRKGFATVDRSVSFLEEQFGRTADAMPAEKYVRAATGQFKGVRTFGQQVNTRQRTTTSRPQPLSRPPASGQRNGADSVRTKPRSSLSQRIVCGAHKAAAAIDDRARDHQALADFPAQATRRRVGTRTKKRSFTLRSLWTDGDLSRLNGIVPPPPLTWLGFRQTSEYRNSSRRLRSAPSTILSAAVRISASVSFLILTGAATGADVRRPIPRAHDESGA